MDWINTIGAAVTICDNDGVIVYMNDSSGKIFTNDGGKELVGTSLFGCHPEPALTKLKEMMENGRTNVYTIEKNGAKKLIYQSPWMNGTAIGGMVEISFELPPVIDHFVRHTP